MEGENRKHTFWEFYIYLGKEQQNSQFEVANHHIVIINEMGYGKYPMNSNANISGGFQNVAVRNLLSQIYLYNLIDYIREDHILPMGKQYSSKVINGKSSAFQWNLVYLDLMT